MPRHSAPSGQCHRPPEHPLRQGKIRGDRPAHPLQLHEHLPAARPDWGWAGGQRAVRRTTRAAAERPRHRADRAARESWALRWGGPGDRESAGPACRQAGERWAPVCRLPVAAATQTGVGTGRLKHGDHLHRRAALGAEQWIDLVDLADQVRPNALIPGFDPPGSCPRGACAAYGRKAKRT